MCIAALSQMNASIKNRQGPVVVDLGNFLFVIHTYVAEHPRQRENKKKRNYEKKASKPSTTGRERRKKNCKDCIDKPLCHATPCLHKLDGAKLLRHSEPSHRDLPHSATRFIIQSTVNQTNHVPSVPQPQIQPAWWQHESRSFQPHASYTYCQNSGEEPESMQQMTLQETRTAHRDRQEDGKIRVH